MFSVEPQFGFSTIVRTHAMTVAVCYDVLKQLTMSYNQRENAALIYRNFDFFISKLNWICYQTLDCICNFKKKHKKKKMKNKTKDKTNGSLLTISIGFLIFRCDVMKLWYILCEPWMSLRSHDMILIRSVGNYCFLSLIDEVTIITDQVAVIYQNLDCCIIDLQCIVSIIIRA